MRDAVAAEHRALPVMLVVAVADNENPEIREEDYAAAMMGIQNLSLAAVALGLGTHVKTGAVMSDPAARAAAGVKDNERIVAVVNIGEPADVPPRENHANPRQRSRPGGPDGRRHTVQPVSLITELVSPRGRCAHANPEV